MGKTFEEITGIEITQDNWNEYYEMIVHEPVEYGEYYVTSATFNPKLKFSNNYDINSVCCMNSRYKKYTSCEQCDPLIVPGALYAFLKDINTHKFKKFNSD